MLMRERKRVSVSTTKCCFRQRRIYNLVPKLTMKISMTGDDEAKEKITGTTRQFFFHHFSNTIYKKEVKVIANWA